MQNSKKQSSESSVELQKSCECCGVILEGKQRFRDYRLTAGETIGRYYDVCEKCFWIMDENVWWKKRQEITNPKKSQITLGVL